MTGIQSPQLAAALAAAARGWRVFPIPPGSKKPTALHGDTTTRPCPRTGICRDGHQGWEQRATTDPDRIRRAWSIAPFNIGIATGPSGLVVIDLDLPKSPTDVPPDGWTRSGIRHGLDVFSTVCADQGQPVPWDTCTVTTPHGGLHLYFQAPAGVQLRNTEGDDGNGLGWKVDTRAWGGCVVGPASITPAGTYQLTTNRQPAALPAWLATRLTPTPRRSHPTTNPAVPVQTDRLPAYIHAAVHGETDRVAAAAPTQHRRVLFTAGLALGQLAGAGLLPPSTAHHALLRAAEPIITGPCQCTHREVDRIITGGITRGMHEPRTITPRAGVTS